MMSTTHKKGEEYANLADKKASTSWFDRFFDKSKKTGDKQSLLNADREEHTKKPAVEAAPPKATKSGAAKKGDKRALLDDSDSDHGESRSPRRR
jgi:hypothetical protein